jgi:ketosteroid isomerase-like protein
MRRSRMLAAVSPLARGLLGGLLCLSCSSENAGTPPPAPVDWHAFDVPHGAITAPPGPTARERAIAEAYAGVLSSADLGGLAPLLAGDVRFAFPGVPDARGKDAVVKAHQTLFGAFDKRTLAMTRLFRTDSAQAIEWTLTGVQARDWMGAAATNKPVAFKGLTLLFTKDDGTISEAHAYFDVAVVKTQLGLGPKELAALTPTPAATGAPQVFEATHTPDEARNVTEARAVLDALEKNDEAAYVATMTDDVVVETLQRAQPMRGRDDQKAYFKAMHRAIGMLDTTLDNSFGVTRFAVAEYFIAGEQLGSLGWLPAQRDKVIRLQVVDVMELRDGKVAHVWRYDNPSQIAGSSL